MAQAVSEIFLARFSLAARIDSTCSMSSPGSKGLAIHELADSEAIDIGHHQIEDNQIGAELDDLKSGFEAVGGGAQGVGGVFAFEGAGY